MVKKVRLGVNSQPFTGTCDLSPQSSGVGRVGARASRAAEEAEAQTGVARVAVVGPLAPEPALLPPTPRASGSEPRARRPSSTSTNCPRPPAPP